jgi:hypothetical protein
MTFLPGADSATPKPAQYFRRKVWGVYVAGDTFHVWTHAEVAELARYGVEGVIPIVVPPQNERWWDDNYGYATLEALVREAKAWGLPEGSPICLDVEEGQSSQMAAPADVLHAWQVAVAVHHFRGWTYGSQAFLLNDHWGLRWMADWPEPTPVDPQLPQGFAGWQYASRDALGIDLDIFEGGRDYLSPHLEVVTLPSPVPVIPTGPSTVAGVSSAPPGAGVSLRDRLHQAIDDLLDKEPK